MTTLCALSVATALLLAGGPAPSPSPTPAPERSLGLPVERPLTSLDLDTWVSRDGSNPQDLPQNSVTAILQSSDGYLWVGTYGGLARFDGVRFRTFDSGNTPALRSSGILALLEDGEGGLWIGTNGGGLTRLRAGAFTTFTKTEGLAGNTVRSLHLGGNGTVWIGTDEGLSRYKDGRFTTWTTADGLANGVVRALAEDTRGTLWIGTNGGGLHRWRDGRIQRVDDAEIPLPNPFVFALLAARDGTLWIGTNGGGLCRLRGGALQTITRRDGLPNDVVWALHEDPAGAVWVGTYGGGLARVRDGRVESLTPTQGLPTGFVRCLASDREGGLWIGFYSGGLGRLRAGRLTTYTRQNGLGHDFTRTVLETRGGVIWVGTTGGGLCRRDGTTFRCLGASDGLGNDIRALHETADGALWVGSVGLGLFRMDPSGTVRRFTTSDGLPHPNVTCIIADGAAGLWVGTNGGGLAHWADGRFSRWGSAEGLPSLLIQAALLDHRGVLWLGTDGAGLVRFEDGRFTSMRQAEGLAGDIVFTLHEDSGGALWVGTASGLSRIEDERITSWGRRDGLSDDVVLGIVEDDEGRLWLSGNRGLSRIDRAALEAAARGESGKLSPVTYGVGDGMKTNECSGIAQPAAWRAHDGTLWFPTTRGVVVVDPARMAASSFVPPVKIEEVVVDGQALGGTEVGPGHTRFEFRYTAPSLLAPQKVRFRYRLIGFDTTWVDAGGQRSAYYTRLGAGDYSFHVIARNEDGVWGPDLGALALHVEPKLHERPYFYVVAGVILLLSSGITYRIHIRNLGKRKRELEAEVESRTTELRSETERAETARLEAERQKTTAEEANRQKDELLSIAAHDLKTPLQTTLTYAEMLSEPRGALHSSEYGALISRAVGRMLSIIDRLLDSEALAQGHIPLARLPVDLARLAERVVALLEPRATAKGLTLHCSAEAGSMVSGDGEWLEEVFENLLGNAVKYSPAGRLIWVTVRRNAEIMVAEVRDEGPGLTDEDKALLFMRFQRLSARPSGGETGTGLGLSIVKQIVELHGGRVYAESEGQGRGSRFVFELPALPIP